MSNTAGILEEIGTVYPSREPGLQSPSILDRVRVAHIFNFLFCDFCFARLRSVFCAQ